MRNLFILLLLCSSLSISGATYYIDPSGNDSNNGSSGSPWKTLAYACSKVNTSGDIIHINAGTYAENTQCSLAVGVSIVGEGDASLITTNYNGGYHHGTIALLSAIGTPVNGNQSVSYIKIDGGNNAVTVHHCTLVNFAGSDAYYAIYNFSNQNNYLTPPTTHATGNAVYNCTFNNCNVYTQGLSGYQFYNNTFNNSVNIELLSSDWMKGFIIHDNVFTKANETVGWHFWGELYHWSDNSEIYNNIFNGSASLDLSDVRKGNGTWGLKVYNNQFLLSAVGPDNLNHNLHPLNFEGWGALQYIYVYNNHLKNTPTAISVGGSNAANCVYPDGTHWALDHIYIYYNIFENVGCTNNTAAATIWFFDYAASGYSYNHSWDNVFVCNNVFPSTASPNQNAEGIYLSNSTTATNFHIDNNIIIGYPSVAIKFQYGSNFNTISLQKNLFYQNGSNSINWGSTPLNKTESNPAPANPLFVSSTDFHLQAGSPAIGNGLAITGLTTDYAGNAVKSPPSIGAYENGSAVATPVSPVYTSSTVENATPSLLTMTYNLTLANYIPVGSAFSVLVNSVARTVNTVVISGTKVQLNLSSHILPGDIVTISYTKPTSNPIQTTSGGTATSITNQPVINDCGNIAPIAEITSPVVNSTFTSLANITITANAVDPDGSVSMVEFYNGSIKLGSNSIAPYSFTWNNVGTGTYSLTVIATDNLNAKTTSSAISISVVNSNSGPNKHPIVKISNPRKGNTYENISTIEIDATASDPDGTISKVEFYNGQTKLVELTSDPYTYTWKDVATGSYTITAIATDNLSDTTISSPVEFVVGANVKYDANSDIINLYPNPNNGHFSIDFINPLKSEKGEIIITDLAGKQIYDGPVLKEEITKQFDLSYAKAGIYVMMIKDKDILVTKKIIKNS